KAVNGDDDGCALEILELGMLNLPIDLGKAFLAAHGQQRVTEGHENAEQTEHLDVCESRPAQESESVIAELEICDRGGRRQMSAANEHRIYAPDHEDYHHHGGDLHNLHGLAARLLDALDVFPPVIDG